MPTKRTDPWFVLLPDEQQRATPVLQAIWFQLFERSCIELAFEERPRMLRCLTTINAYHRALHDYFAFACIGQPVDPLERAVALHFCEEALVDVAPEWAVEADDPDVLRDGIYNYTPDNPPMTPGCRTFRRTRKIGSGSVN